MIKVGSIQGCRKLIERGRDDLLPNDLVIPDGHKFDRKL